MNCNRLVTMAYRRDGSAIDAQCGSYFGGERVLCAYHEKQAIKAYPQGWRYYPGDTCPHGVYVGGSGADYMCGRCEMGG